jgi:hypothetical protein
MFRMMCRLILDLNTIPGPTTRGNWLLRIVGALTAGTIGENTLQEDAAASIMGRNRSHLVLPGSRGKVTDTARRSWRVPR